jgi:WD40 repeat protein
MRPLIGHVRPVRAMAYAPGAEPLLATASDDRTVRIWDVVSGASREPMPGGDGLLSLAFSPDGKRLAVGGRAGSIAAYDVATRQRDPGATAITGAVVSLAFTADGRALLAGSRSQGAAETRCVTCWNLAPLHPPEALVWSGDLERAAFAPARDLLAIAGQGRAVEFLEVGRPRNEPAFWTTSRVRALAFSPGEGRYLAVAGGKAVGVWDVEARAWKSRCAGHKGDVNALAFSPDGLALLSGGMDRSVRLFETLSGRQLAAWEWKVGVVNALAFATDGMTAAVAGEKPQVIVWDVDEG